MNFGVMRNYSVGIFPDELKSQRNKDGIVGLINHTVNEQDSTTKMSKAAKARLNYFK